MYYQSKYKLNSEDTINSSNPIIVMNCLEDAGNNCNDNLISQPDIAPQEAVNVI